MKQAVIAMLLVFGVSAGAWACDAGSHPVKPGTTTPAAPAPAK